MHLVLMLAVMQNGKLSATAEKRSHRGQSFRGGGAVEGWKWGGARESAAAKRIDVPAADPSPNHGSFSPVVPR